MGPGPAELHWHRTFDLQYTPGPWRVSRGGQVPPSVATPKGTAVHPRDESPGLSRSAFCNTRHAERSSQREGWLLSWLSGPLTFRASGSIIDADTERHKPEIWQGEQLSSPGLIEKHTMCLALWTGESNVSAAMLAGSSALLARSRK